MIQRLQGTANSSPRPLGNAQNENINQNNMKGEGNNRNNHERFDHNGINVIDMRVWDIGLESV